MTWIFLSIGLGVAGLAVLAVAGVRVLAAARALNREIADAHQRIGTKSASGDEAAPRAAYDRA